MKINDKLCAFGCGKEGKFYSKRSKKWRCAKSANSCEARRKADSIRKKGINPFENREHPRGMLGKKGALAGTTYDEKYGAERSKEIKKKIADSNKNHNTWELLDEHQTKEAKRKLRQAINKRYEEGWEPKAGRCKKIKYNSPIAGTVYLDGKWEYDVAQWLDSQGLDWIRNKKKFKYMNPNGDQSNYTPDFWVDEWKAYIEVKGYETEKDRCKWRDFPEKL